MGRVARRQLSSGVYHVLNRAAGRLWVLEEVWARELLLAELARFAGERPVVIHHWCIMANHFHLAMEAARIDDLTYAVGQATRRFSLGWHRRVGGSGTVWQGRLRSILVEKEGYLGRLGHYIERNPLAARVPGVTAPGDYPWSSARAYALGTPDPLVDPRAHPDWHRMGHTDEERRACYTANPLTERERQAERRLFDGTHGPVVGTDSFVANFRLAHGRPHPRPRGRPRKGPLESA